MRQQAEALFLTSAIYLKYEDNLPQALAYADPLNRHYSRNLLFKVLYVENLIQSNKIGEAELQLAQIESSNNSYYKLPVRYSRCMIEERYYKRLILAEKFYNKAIQFKPDWDTGNHVGLAYFGLGNICKLRGDKENAKKYYKKANALCEYISIKEATKNY